jgi:hypothetical protein
VKLKLDENIPQRGAELLRAAGHDVSTVRDQKLEGSSDEVLFGVCARESRALVTLDRDFGQVLRFPPRNSAGIAVLELGPRPSLAALLTRLRELAVMLSIQPLTGSLWIVEPGRVRIHLDGDGE